MKPSSCIRQPIWRALVGSSSAITANLAVYQSTVSKFTANLAQSDGPKFALLTGEGSKVPSTKQNLS